MLGRPYFWLTFFRFLIKSMAKNVLFLLFCVLFRVLFPTLETLKIVLPPARELNFYKISFFVLDEKKR